MKFSSKPWTDASDVFSQNTNELAYCLKAVYSLYLQPSMAFKDADAINPWINNFT